MSKKRMLDTRVWVDGWFADELNPLDRYLFLYLLMNERTTISGIYEVPLRTIANDTGIDRDQLGKMLKRLEPKIYYQNGWVIITNGIRHQNYKSPKIKAALQRELCDAPAELIEKLRLPQDLELELVCPIDTKRYGMDTVSIPQHILNLTKPNLTKLKTTNVVGADAPVRHGKPEINELFDLWEHEVGYKVEGKITANRRAASNLLKKYGPDKLGQLIKGVALAQNDKYAPRIADFCDLQAKANQLIAWGKTEIHGSTSSRGVKI